MKFKRTLLATSMLLAGSAQAAAPSNEEIWKMLQDMKAQMSEIQQQNQQLKSENAALKNQVTATEQVANEAAEAAEAVAVVAEEAVKSSSNSFLNKTSLGVMVNFTITILKVRMRLSTSIVLFYSWVMSLQIDFVFSLS